jgi:methionyl-tRNA formyltransferase
MRSSREARGSRPKPGDPTTPRFSRYIKTIGFRMKILILSQFSDIIENEIPKCDEEIVYIRNVREFDIFKAYVEYAFDLLICFGYGRVLPVGDPRLSRVRFINLHTSLLPYGRGLNPNFSSWLNNEPHGVTIHEMDGSYDTGRIIYQKPLNFDIEAETLRSTYYKKILAAIELLAEKWDGIVAGTYEPIEQIGGPGSLMTLQKLRSYADVLAAYNDEPLADFLKAVKDGRIAPSTP